MTELLGAVAIHAAALYVPFTQFALSLEPIAPQAWLEILATSLSVVVVVELHKLARARWPTHESAPVDSTRPGDCEA